MNTLSPREEEVLALLKQGKQRKQIAEDLHVSFHTIGTHLKNIYTKLEVHNAVEATQKTQ